MKTLQHYFTQALQNKWAVPHFNIATLEQLHAMVNVATRLQSPLHIGTSGGEAGHIGLQHAVALIQASRKISGLPIFLNADHFHSVKEAKEAIDAGYDSINIDLSKESYEDNIAGTAEVVSYARAKNPHISIEGELGYLRGSSKIQKETITITADDMTDPEQAQEYVEKTGVDRLAPAIGNIHGIAANEPNIDVNRITEIRKHIPDTVALVLHGGSGITDTQIKQAISAGINNVHVNTEIRVVYAETLRTFLAEHPDETTPYKMFPSVISAMEEKIEEKIRLFGSNNQLSITT